MYYAEVGKHQRNKEKPQPIITLRFVVKNVKSFFPAFQVVDASQHKECSSHICFVTKKLLKEIFKRRTAPWTPPQKETPNNWNSEVIK